VTFLASLDRRTLLFIARALDDSGPWLWALDTETKVTRRANSASSNTTPWRPAPTAAAWFATVVHPTASLWSVPDSRANRRGSRSLQPLSPVPTEQRALAPRFGGTIVVSSCLRHGTADGTQAGVCSGARAMSAEIRRPFLAPTGAFCWSRPHYFVRTAAAAWTVVLATDKRRRPVRSCRPRAQGCAGLAESELMYQGQAPPIGRRTATTRDRRRRRGAKNDDSTRLWTIHDFQSDGRRGRPPRFGARRRIQSGRRMAI
jgi:hypothetical protein